MTKDDLQYLRAVLVTEHEARSDAPAAADEIEAALAQFSLQAEVETLAAREAADPR